MVPITIDSPRILPATCASCHWPPPLNSPPCNAPYDSWTICHWCWIHHRLKTDPQTDWFSKRPSPIPSNCTWPSKEHWKNKVLDSTRPCSQPAQNKNKIHGSMDQWINATPWSDHVFSSCGTGSDRVSPTWIIKTGFTYLIKSNIEKNEHLIVLGMSVKHKRKIWKKLLV